MDNHKPSKDTLHLRLRQTVPSPRRLQSISWEVRRGRALDASADVCARLARFVHETSTEPAGASSEALEARLPEIALVRPTEHRPVPAGQRCAASGVILVLTVMLAVALNPSTRGSASSIAVIAFVTLAAMLVLSWTDVQIVVRWICGIAV